MKDTSDEELMKAYALGNARAFDHLYLRYEKRVFAFLISRLSSSHKQTVNDLFQLVWLKLHQARSSYDSEKKFSTWVFAIAINLIRDHMRSTRANFMDLTDDGFEESRNTTTDFAPDPEAIVLSKESLKQIQYHLEKLAAEQKNAILLVDIEGFSNTEAAEMLGTTDTAFRKLLSRARKILGQHITNGGSQNETIND